MVKDKDRKKRKAKKCDLCKGFEDGPQCVKYCSAICLAVSDGTLPWEQDKEEESA